MLTEKLILALAQLICAELHPVVETSFCTSPASGRSSKKNHKALHYKVTYVNLLYASKAEYNRYQLQTNL